MAVERPGPRFLTANTRSLRRAGIRGNFAGVFLVVDTLAILGETSGVVKILPTDVERIRIGYGAARFGSVFETRVWRKGDARPLVIRLRDSGESAFYRDIVLGFAALVAAAGGMHRIERGETHFRAWLPAAAFALLSVAAIGVGRLALADGAWWERAAPVSIPFALLVLFVWNAATRTAPRRIATMAELERQLP